MLRQRDGGHIGSGVWLGTLSGPNYKIPWLTVCIGVENQEPQISSPENISVPVASSLTNHENSLGNCE